MATLDLILDLKNKLSAKLKSANTELDAWRKKHQARMDTMSGQGLPLPLEKKPLQAMKQQIPALGAGLDMLTNKYVLAGAGIAAVGTALYKATSMANQWQQGMAKINVTAQLSKKELANLSDELLNIGRRAPVAIEQIPEAFNKIISAGLDVDTSKKVLMPSLMAAKAGFTDVETAAKAAVSVMNSAGISDATKAYDILFATMNKGNAEFGDISRYLPKIIPAALNAGVSLEQTAGAYAFLTAQGLYAESASVGLANVFRSLSNPAIQKGFRSIGLSVYDTSGKLKSLTQIAEMMNAKLRGLGDEQRSQVLASIGFDQESANAMSMMSKDAKNLEKSIGFVQNSAGQLKAAFENAKTPMDSLTRIFNEIKYQMITIGEGIISLIAPPLEWVANNLSTIKDLFYGAAAALAVFSAGWLVMNTQLIAYKVATIAATVAQWALNIAMIANPIGLIIAAIGLLVGAFVVMYRKFDWFRAGIAGIWAVIKAFFSNMWESIKAILSGFFYAAKAIWKVLTFDFSGAKKDFELSGKSFSKLKDLAQNNGRTYADEFKKGYNDKMAADKLKPKEDEQKNGSSPGAGLPETGANASPEVNASLSGSVHGGTGGSAKSITINISNLIGTLSMQVEQLTKGTTVRDIEKIVTETVIKSLRNVEASYN